MELADNVRLYNELVSLQNQVENIYNNQRTIQQVQPQILVDINQTLRNIYQQLQFITNELNKVNNQQTSNQINYDSPPERYTEDEIEDAIDKIQVKSNIRDLRPSEAQKILDILQEYPDILEREGINPQQEQLENQELLFLLHQQAMLPEFTSQMIGIQFSPENMNQQRLFENERDLMILKSILQPHNIFSDVEQRNIRDAKIIITTKPELLYNLTEQEQLQLQPFVAKVRREALNKLERDIIQILPSLIAQPALIQRHDAQSIAAILDLIKRRPEVLDNLTLEEQRRFTSALRQYLI